MENHCGITFGKHPLVKRVLKGIFEARPVFPKYNTVWDVNTLFKFFRSLGNPDCLSMGVLGKKLVFWLVGSVLKLFIRLL